ncbi:MULTISPECIES: TonB-dependent siderophore receptor [unclassified Brenneria]|uniref:TonB-dependent siderophore receptor n=1 Tax=unclassified Brenneria TaxID=2634434 RepID=UPI0029C1DE45|nr:MULTISPECIES: TonB-dependent siderophore receptor [unclassified Brenneria]MDX5628311.1 TonB-dependent siderophore receptor [Brenneria sp. L3-3Z]MDX5695506.1 TonB-dependent siderophore receptor [Brenneria sp. L4-2C]
MSITPYFSRRGAGRTPKTIAVAIRILLCGAPLLISPGMARADVQTPHAYAIPAGSLNAQLNQFAAQSGVYLVGDAALASGKSGAALQGNYGVEDGFRALLAGSGLQAVRQSDNTYILQQAPKSDEMLVIANINQNGMTEGTRSYTTRSMNTATQLNLSPRETPQSVSVVTRQRMDDQNMTTLDEAMSQTTGVNVVNESSYQTKFQSRGFTMDNVKEDGASSSFQNSVSGMGFSEASSESPDLAIYDRVEILRGASGLTQGNGEPGGTVNLVRKKPTYDFHASGSVGAGSWDNYRSEMDISGPLNDDASLRGRIVGVYQDKQSFVDYVDSERKVLFGTLAWDMTPNTTLTAGINWQKTATVPDLYGLPLSTNYASLKLPRSTFLGASWNRITFEKINPFAEIEHTFDNDWTLKSALNYSRSTSEGKFIGIFGNGINGVDGSGSAKLNNGIQRDNQSDQWGYNLSLSGPFELLGRNHELVLGGDYQKENFDNLFGRITTSPYSDNVNIFQWNPSSLAEPDWSDYTRRYQYDIYQRALFATTRLELADDWKLILGSRYSAFSYDMYNTNRATGNTTHPSSYKVRDKLIPYAGLLWDFADNYTWYASYSDIYKPQEYTDRNKALLPAVSGKNYETGIKGEFFDGDLNASIALYRIIQANRAVADTNCPDGDACYRPEGKVRSQGVELEVSGKLAEGWQLFTGYTLTNTKYLEGKESDRGQTYSPYTPQHMFKLYSSYNLPGTLNQWTVGAGLTAQTDTNTTYNVYQGGYTLVNANITYQYSKNLSFNLVGNNLTDKVYYKTLNNRHRGAYNYYGDPRNFMLTAKYTF